MSIKTGVPKLDEITKGGLPNNSLTLFWTYPGVENTPFVYQSLFSALKEGYSVIYMVNNKPVDDVRDELSSFGWTVSNFEKKKNLVFIDAYSKLINRVSKEKLVVEKPKEVKEITNSLKKAVESTDGNKKIFVLDNVSTLIDMCGDNSIQEFSVWKSYFKKNKMTGLFLFTEWPYKKPILKKLRNISDIIIGLKAVEERVILRKYYTIDKGVKGVKKIGVPFEIVEPGGVRVYIPKILVTGPYNAGKSSFVHSASIRSVSVDRVGTTIALDHGHVDYAGFSLDLFGTPGQARFDPILKVLGGQSLGVIIVIDSTTPESFPRAKEMLIKTRTAGLPFVVAANKANLKGALSVKEIREVFKFDNGIQIIPVRAQDLSKIKKGVKSICKLRKGDIHKVLDSLFSIIIKVD